jgi:hypothetical protein
MKLDLLTNATVVDAIRFVSQQSRENVKSSSSNEPNYDEDEEQEEEYEEITTNNIFRDYLVILLLRFICAPIQR